MERAAARNAGRGKAITIVVTLACPRTPTQEAFSCSSGQKLGPCCHQFPVRGRGWSSSHNWRWSRLPTKMLLTGRGIPGRVSDVGGVMLECRPDSGTHMPVLCSKQWQNAVWCLLKRVTTGRVITVTMSTHARARTQYRTYHTQEQRCHHGYSLRPCTPPHCGLWTHNTGSWLCPVSRVMAGARQLGQVAAATQQINRYLLSKGDLVWIRVPTVFAWTIIRQVMFWWSALWD